MGISVERQHFLGKKVFFLYPHSVIQDELVEELIANEYEVYLLDDHKKIRSLLEKYPTSILFINIDEGMSEKDWVTYVSSITNDGKFVDVGIGILTYNENPDLAKTYLMDLMITCGFIRLKLGLEQSTEIILKTLEASEARGARKYVRASCDGQSNTSFNVKYKGDLVKGNITDISSVGMSFTFQDPQIIPKNTLLSAMQLQLRGKIIMVNGVVLGKRVVDGELDLYVVMFAKMDLATRHKIHLFIRDTLQQNIKKELTVL